MDGQQPLSPTEEESNQRVFKVYSGLFVTCWGHQGRHHVTWVGSLTREPSRLRSEALTGCVRPELWGGGLRPDSGKPHLGPSPELGLGRDCRFCVEYEDPRGGKVIYPPLSPPTPDKPKAGGKDVESALTVMRVGDSFRWKVTPARVGLVGN